MGKIIIEQYIPCYSFENAKVICNTFENFHIREYYFGNTQTIKASRYIRKFKGDSFSHYALIRYSIKFNGEFCKYGFIDEKSIKRYPELPSLVENTPIHERWKIIYSYKEKDDYGYDIYYYKNFEDFYNSKLILLLNRIDMVCKVAFGCKYNTENFAVYFEECGQAFERGFIANNDVTHGLSFLRFPYIKYASFPQMQIQLIWDWSQKNYFNNKGIWHSEAKAWAALSYTINRNGLESLFYSIMGLEAVYTNGNKGIKKQLRETVPRVINYITENDINELYKLRSEFVHGDIAYPVYGSNEHFYYESDIIIKAAIVLLETVRLLVQNNATKIRLIDGNVKYICDKTF